MTEKVKAVIHLEVPKWQIGNNVTVYFPDTMTLKAICESEEEFDPAVDGSLEDWIGGENDDDRRS